MTLKTLSAKNAALLDADLMSISAFSLDQLMELAGLSVSQAVYRVHPPSKGENILIACGPGNNGGDGLVAARHLWHYGYKPTIYYPKRGKNELFEVIAHFLEPENNSGISFGIANPIILQRLTTQLQTLNIPFTDDFDTSLKTTHHIIDAVFGFSFSDEIRPPFPPLITAFEETSVPITSIDAPSSWNIESGPPKSGPGKKFHPASLVSLTAPKPLVKYFRGRHFLGGRFLPPAIAEKYDLDLPEYEGVEQIVELSNDGNNDKAEKAEEILRLAER